MPRASRESNSGRKKSCQIAMSRHNISHVYCPQQIWAMSCFGLAQGDVESEYNASFLSSLSFHNFNFSDWLASDVRKRSDRYHEIPIFIILLYRRLLWCTRDIVKNVSITLYPRLIPGEHEMIFSRTSLYFLYCHQSNVGAHDALTSNNNSQ